MSQKIYPTPAAALEGLLFDGMTIMSGGFGLSGNPESLIPEIRASGVRDLTVISNNAGADGFGLWMLLETRQIAKMVASYVGENKLFEAQFLSGELELELTPQARWPSAFAQAALVFPPLHQDRRWHGGGRGQASREL
jgi:3-oxoacid CoA-transferase subunit A